MENDPLPDPDFVPTSASVDDGPAFTLHPTRGVVWAAFWGSFIAAGIVMAINFARIGEKAAAWTTVAVGFVTTIAVFALVFVLPDSLPVPDIVFVIPQLIAVYLIANALQGKTIQAHADAGGDVASAWPSAGIGLLCLPFVVAGVFGAALLFEQSFGTKIEFGEDEIYIAGEATEADARKLATALEEVGFFANAGVSVRIETIAGNTTVSFILIDNAWEDPEMVTAFRELGGTLTEAGFPKPLTLELCDGYFEPQKTLTIE
ncbi:MAG: hypothetical protein AAGI68_04525 [Planctomycetota bacterium]